MAIRDTDRYCIDAYGRPLYAERYDETEEFRNGEAMCEDEEGILFHVDSEAGKRKHFSS